MGEELAHGQIASDFAAKLSEAWHVHDMQAFAALFRDDAVFVNVNGRYSHGRDEIWRHNETLHTAGFFRNSTMSMSVEDSRSPAAGVIVAHTGSEVRGDERAPGQVRRTVMMLVIEQKNGEWKISAAQNTNVVTPPG
jgi:uncharacterized protein (TIGR02246 family)